MGKTKRQWLALFLCSVLAAGGVAWQLVSALAEGECTCVIQAHGSDCPLSRCTCDGADTGAHAEDCALYDLNSDMTACVCQPSIHAEGCPRYEGVGELLDSDSAVDGNDVVQDTEASASDKQVSQAEVTEAEVTESGTESSSEAAALADPDEEPLDIEVPEDLDAMEEGWEYPSGWSGYGEGQMRGNVLLAAQAFELDAQLEEYVATVRGYLTNGDNARLLEDTDNFGDVLAVYAVLSGQTEDYPYGIALEEDDRVLLSSVYWSMTQVTGLSNASGAAISIRRLSALEGAELYNFTAEQKTELLSLVEQSDVVDAIVEESIFASLTAEEFEEVLSLVSEDISAERRAVLLAAVSLNGKVGYFWGGKSLAYGWDDRWGEMRTVSSEGSDTYGIARPLGLDCSGFVSWAFINVYGTGNYSALGTSVLWSDTTSVAWSDAQPGDLVFYYEPDSGQTNHVGIVLTVGENGPETVVHCASGGGVQISGAEGFSYVRRPAIYS